MATCTVRVEDVMWSMWCGGCSLWWVFESSQLLHTVSKPIYNMFTCPSLPHAPHPHTHINRDIDAVGMKRSDLVRTVEAVLADEEGAVPLDGVLSAQYPVTDGGDVASTKSNNEDEGDFSQYTMAELQQMADMYGIPADGDREELVEMLSSVMQDTQMPSIPTPRMQVGC